MDAAAIIIAILIFVVVCAIGAFLAGISYEMERREKEKLDHIINCLNRIDWEKEKKNDEND